MHFYKFKHAKDGMESACKECRGFSFKTNPRAKDGYKICSKCQAEKRATKVFFRTNKGNKGGLDGLCIECRKENNKEIYRKNKGNRTRFNKKYYVENREAILEQSKEYRQTNLEKLKAKDKRYYEKKQRKS